MEATWAGRLAAFLGALAVTQIHAEEVPAPRQPSASPEANSISEAAPKPTSSALSDPEAARSEVQERLKRLVPSEDKRKELAAGPKALVEVLKERLDWLDEWDKAVQARRQAEHPEPSPERQAADLKAELERVKATLDQAAKSPDSLLPTAFRRPPAQVTDSLRAEMKDAIDAVQSDLKEWSGKLEKLRGDPARPEGGPLPALRAERDKIHQRVATLKTRRSEREAALAAARTTETRELARECLVNFDWESRVEQERLQGHESRMALDSKLTDLAALRAQVYEAHELSARKTLDGMQGRFKAVADRAERALKQEADSEQQRAAKTDDPLERFRARRKSQLLEIKAQVVKSENAVASAKSSVEEQRRLADRAETDFAGIKKLLDDGKVSHLDALRLNNDFRRIGPERSRIVKNELAAAAHQLANDENALSGVELAQINDSRDDRYEYEGLLERLPPARHRAAQNVFDELETENAKLLEQHRVALSALATSAEECHDQILRRLRILDDQYGFIRTHIFWVRDQEPIGAVTFAQARREAGRLGKGLFHFVLEVRDRALWGRVSWEFVLGVLAALALPWPWRRFQRWLQPGRNRLRPATFDPA